jgi:hypothetical protein
MEPFGMTPMEAGRAGVAVVVSERAGCAAEFLRDREHAVVIDPDDAAGFGAAIWEVLTDDALRERLIANNTAKVAETTWENNVLTALRATAAAIAATAQGSTSAIEPGTQPAAFDFLDWVTDPTPDNYDKVRAQWLVTHPEPQLHAGPRRARTPPYPPRCGVREDRGSEWC